MLYIIPVRESGAVKSPHREQITIGISELVSEHLAEAICLQAGSKLMFQRQTLKTCFPGVKGLPEWLTPLDLRHDIRYSVSDIEVHNI